MELYTHFVFVYVFGSTEFVAVDPYRRIAIEFDAICICTILWQEDMWYNSVST